MTKRKIKKRKKEFRLMKVSFSMFLLACISYLGSSLFLRSYNNSISTKQQEIAAQISSLQVQNDAVAVEVNTLNNRDRVNTIANDNGLSLDESNIVTITKTDTGE